MISLSSPYLSFQSTPPARGATAFAYVVNTDNAISIHAPREGGDDQGREHCQLSSQFQSTPPARGATYRLFDGSGYQ